MDPVTLVIVPGFLGGLILACVVVLSRRRGTPGSLCDAAVPS